VSGEGAAEAVGAVITRRVPSSNVAAFEAGLSLARQGRR
jgi:hypothetical protein